jgi:DNA-binding MarR family transcriptional regulator
MGARHHRSLRRHPALVARAKGDPVNKSDRLAHLTKEAWRAFTRAMQARLAEHAVPFGHWTFLRILWERDGLTQRELSDEAGVMESSTFAALKAMEELGYVRRKQVPGNRKNVYIDLTPKGRALEARLVPLAEEVNAIAVRGVSAAEVAAARATLLAVVENLTRPSPRKPSPPRRSDGPRRGSPRRTPAASSRPRRSRAG